MHEEGYAVGDISELDNVILSENDNLYFVDCNPGEPDAPNCDYRSDCTEELLGAAQLFFGNNKPDSVINFEETIKARQRIGNSALRNILSHLGY